MIEELGGKYRRAPSREKAEKAGKNLRQNQTQRRRRTKRITPLFERTLTWISAGFLTELRTTDTYKYLGKIEKIVGMTIEASGPLCSIGDVSRIYTKRYEVPYPAEVVGFNEHKVLLMPYTDLEGIGPGSMVDNYRRQAECKSRRQADRKNNRFALGKSA